LRYATNSAAPIEDGRRENEFEPTHGPSIKLRHKRQDNVDNGQSNDEKKELSD